MKNQERIWILLLMILACMIPWRIGAQAVAEAEATSQGAQLETQVRVGYYEAVGFQ